VKHTFSITCAVLLVGFLFAPAPINRGAAENPLYATARHLLVGEDALLQAVRVQRGEIASGSLLVLASNHPDLNSLFVSDRCSVVDVADRPVAAILRRN
jgi:hypothetical protein